jgi:hypothetical protein
MRRFPGIAPATIWVILTLVALQWSCNTAPRTSTQAASPAPVGEDKTSQPIIGLVVGDTPPQFDVQQGGSSASAGSGMLKGAGKGARWCISPFGVDPDLRAAGQGAMVYFLWVAVCAPVGAVVGASVGGISANNETTKQVQVPGDFKKEVQRSASTAQQDVLEALEQYAAANGVSTLRLPSRFAAPPSNLNTKQASLSKAVGMLLEVNIVRLTAVARSVAIMADGLAVEARIRVIAVPSRKVLDSYSFVRLPSAPTRIEAQQDSVGMDLARAYQEIAEAALDESVLVYRGNKSVATQKMPASSVEPVTHETAFPEYTLRPISPPAENDHSRFSSRGGETEKRLSTNLLPVFQWEPLPTNFARDPALAGGMQDLTYEFRLYQRWSQTPLIRRGLLSPTYSLETQLSPCELYLWTVRAHFTLDGRPRVTEWTGAYDGGGFWLEASGTVSRVRRWVDPAWYRRNSFPKPAVPLPNAAYYAQFRTPATSPSERCPEDAQEPSSALPG